MRVISGVLLAAALVTVAGAADTDAKLLMTERGKALFTDDLNQPLGEKWKTAKGDWKITEGVLSGTERKDDMHNAAARHPVSFEDGIVQVSFRLDGAKAFHLSINDATGHVGRVSIDEKGFSLRKDKHDKNSTDAGMLIERRKLDIEKGKWYVLSLEMCGDEWVARVGNETALGSNMQFKGKKANLGLIVTGDGASFKDLRVWEATPAKDWAKIKEDLLARRKKP
jgi:hypothetical protein